MRYLAFGTEFALTIGLMLAGGLWLDNKTGMLPLFTLVGACVGFALGLYLLIRRARAAKWPDKTAEKDQGPTDRRENGI